MTTTNNVTYTQPIKFDSAHVSIDSTPDFEGDLELYDIEGDHIAYLKPADQIVLRDLLNRLHP